MIDILLATYNGEKYIEFQIYSLLAQTHKDWRLLIHDDGSTDKTIEIIKKFQKMDSRIILVEDGIKCGGAGANFLHLLKNYAQADYIVYCDQDDIWLEHKLEVMYHRLKQENAPTTVFSGGYLYKDRKEIFGEIPSPVLVDFKDIFFISGGLQGCSLMFNKALLDKVRNYDGYMFMHDDFITISTYTFGKMIYLDQKLMLYRQQHQGKVTANIDLSAKTRLFKNKFPVILDKWHRSLVSFFDFYDSELTAYQKKTIADYLVIYHSKSKLKSIFLIWKNNFKLNHSSLYLILKVILRPLK